MARLTYPPLTRDDNAAGASTTANAARGHSDNRSPRKGGKILVQLSASHDSATPRPNAPEVYVPYEAGSQIERLIRRWCARNGCSYLDYEIVLSKRAAAQALSNDDVISDIVANTGCEFLYIRAKRQPAKVAARRSPTVDRDSPASEVHTARRSGATFKPRNTGKSSFIAPPPLPPHSPPRTTAMASGQNAYPSTPSTVSASSLFFSTQGSPSRSIGQSLPPGPRGSISSSTIGSSQHATPRARSGRGSIPDGSRVSPLVLDDEDDWTPSQSSLAPSSPAPSLTSSLGTTPGSFSLPFTRLSLSASPSAFGLPRSTPVANAGRVSFGVTSPPTSQNGNPAGALLKIPNVSPFARVGLPTPLPQHSAFSGGDPPAANVSLLAPKPNQHSSPPPSMRNSASVSPFREEDASRQHYPAASSSSAMPLKSRLDQPPAAPYNTTPAPSIHDSGSDSPYRRDDTPSAHTPSRGASSSLTPEPNASSLRSGPIATPPADEVLVLETHEGFRCKLNLLAQQARISMPLDECLNPPPSNLHDGLYAKEDILQHGFACQHRAGLEVKSEINAKIQHMTQRITAGGMSPHQFHAEFVKTFGHQEDRSEDEEEARAYQVPLASRFDSLYTAKEVRSFGRDTYAQARLDWNKKLKREALPSLEAMLKSNGLMRENLKRLEDLCADDGSFVAVTLGKRSAETSGGSQGKKQKSSILSVASLRSTGTSKDHAIAPLNVPISSSGQQKGKSKEMPPKSASLKGALSSNIGVSASRAASAKVQDCALSSLSTIVRTGGIKKTAAASACRGKVRLADSDDDDSEDDMEVDELEENTAGQAERGRRLESDAEYQPEGENSDGESVDFVITGEVRGPGSNAIDLTQSA